MTINISKATKKEIKTFEEKEWKKVNIEHYGQSVKWVKKRFVFKATQNGEIVGTIKGYYETGVIYIDTLMVAEEKRQRGIGKRLMEKVEELGKQLGAHKIFLFTMEEWEASKFYKRLGFKKTGNLPKHYLKRDFVIYSKLI